MGAMAEGRLSWEREKPPGAGEGFYRFSLRQTVHKKKPEQGSGWGGGGCSGPRSFGGGAGAADF